MRLTGDTTMTVLQYLTAQDTFSEQNRHLMAVQLKNIIKRLQSGRPVEAPEEGDANEEE